MNNDTLHHVIRWNVDWIPRASMEEGVLFFNDLKICSPLKTRSA